MKPGEYERTKFNKVDTSHGNFRGKQEQTICATCKKTFYYYIAQKHNNKGKYCSNPCRFEGQRGKSKTGKKIANGYIYLNFYSLPKEDQEFIKPMTFNVNGSKYVAEHRFIMAKHLSRMLSKNETIHHKNQNRGDNKLNNLEITLKKLGRHRGKICCPKCNFEFSIL